MSKPPAKLLQVWRFMRWLDRARWHTMANAIPGRVFEDLEPDQKVLTHWLCYVTNQQRPSEQVWEHGGPIFAEIVRTYAGAQDNALDILKRFTEPAKKPKGVDRFTAKVQRVDGQLLSFTPRFGMQLLSIATTLAVLEEYNRSLIQYIATHWAFCAGESEGETDDPTHRMAFLLHLLTYLTAAQAKHHIAGVL